MVYKNDLGSFASYCSILELLTFINTHVYGKEDEFDFVVINQVLAAHQLPSYEEVCNKYLDKHETLKSFQGKSHLVNDTNVEKPKLNYSKQYNTYELEKYLTSFAKNI